MFIVPGRTELILLSWFIVCCKCLIHLFSCGSAWVSHDSRFSHPHEFHTDYSVCVDESPKPWS